MSQNQKEEVKVDTTQGGRPNSESNSPVRGQSGPTYEAFVKNLPFQTTFEEIKAHFQQCGTVERVNVLKGFNGRSKGVAFVRFSDEGSLNKALALTGSDFDGRSITIEKAVPKEQRPQGDRPERGDRQPRERDNQPRNERDPESTSVFVGNLSYSTSEDRLRDLFSDCGGIREVRIATDPSGRSRGFAHVDFEGSDAVEKAVQKSGENIDGREIRVDFSNKRQDGGSRGGSRGGFGSRGGYRGGSRGGNFSRGGPSGERGGFRGGFRGSRRGN